MVLRLRILLVYILVIISCSTPYKPKGMLYGYSSKQLEENIFKVTFQGNQHTKQEKTRSYLFYYCAELTLQNGFEYYYVASDSSHFVNRTIRGDVEVPGKSTSTMSGGINVRPVPSFYYPSKTTLYIGEFVIHMFKQNVPEHKDYMIHATQVIKDLGKNIKK